MHRTICLTTALIFAVLPAMAEDEPGGTLNPQELSIQGMFERMKAGESHPMMGVIGYGAAKSGAHETAREIFEKIAREGNVQGMTWLSWMEDNGLAGMENPEAAAEWDRRAAEAGSSVAMFNYGLDLLRGRGVAQDEALGRQVIERAAVLGETSAQHLIDNDFDLDSVTPDADNWKYQKNYF